MKEILEEVTGRNFPKLICKTESKTNTGKLNYSQMVESKDKILQTAVREDSNFTYYEKKVKNDSRVLNLCH